MKSNEFVRVADFLARAHKITVKEGQGWAANIKNREVFYRKQDIYTLAEDHILGLLLHEIAHIHYTTDSTLPKKNEALMHTTMNMLEDISIEHIISGDYPNAGEILKSTETELLDTLVRMLPKMKDVAPHEKAILYAAVKFRGRGYTFGFEDYEKLGDKIADIMIARGTEIYDRKRTAELIPLAQTIVDMLLKAFGEPTDQQKQQMMGDAKSHTEAHEQTQNNQAEKKTIEAMGGQGFLGDGNVIANDITLVDEITDQAGTIGKQLRTVLKRNNAMEFGGRYRTGKLMTKRIVRIRVNKDRRPFGRRIVKSNQSYAFAIASDVSGSMFNRHYSGQRRLADPGDYALSSMQMVGEALRKAGIQRTMIVFGGKAQVAVPMTKLAIRFSQLANKSLLTRADQNSTSIDKAMRACTKQLKTVRAERKIMVILTDGSSDMYEMQEAYKEAKHAGVECIAITIGGSRDYMDQVFVEKNNYNIPNPKDTQLIGKAFIDLLKKTVKKST
jgi:hypothetical protein